jgi:hypothetical protein
MLQHYCMTNTQSFSYRTSRFKRRFIQYRQNFGIKIIQRRSCSANFVMEVLTTESYLSNSESNCLESVGMFIKLCLKYGCNLVCVSSLVPEKSDDHFLIMLHHKRTLNGFWHPECKYNFLENDTVKSNLIYLAFRKIHTVEIYCHERQTLNLNAWGWDMYFPTRRYLSDDIFAASLDEVIPREKAPIEAQKVMLTIFSAV